MSNYIFNEEKLYWEIKAAKEKWKEIYWKVSSVSCRKDVREIDLTFELKEEYRLEDCHCYDSYVLDIYNLKIFKGKTGEEIEKVSLLGERAIQWEELDIQINLDDLLMSIQLRENWLNSLK
jgi:hypothetical protein